MLIAGPLGAALGYGLLALGKNAPFVLGVLVPMVLLGISFAVLVAPLTASVLSSVKNKEAGLASGVNNAVSRIAQLAGVALTAGVTSYAAGFVASLISCDDRAVMAALVYSGFAIQGNDHFRQLTLQSGNTARSYCVTLDDGNAVHYGFAWKLPSSGR
jgi:hypothetical protein